MKKEVLIESLSDKYAHLDHAYRIYCEKKKFKNPRRRKIAETYPLSKEQKEQIDELYISHYGKKIDYVWHQNYAAHAKKFDYCFFPELLYGPEFEIFQNQDRAACQMLSDKNFLPILAKVADVKMPHTIISCTNGILRDEDDRIISDAMANEVLHSQSWAFVKPSTSSCSGQGCKLISKTDKCVIDNNSLIINDLNGEGTCVTMSFRVW